ncbi:asialoglycoprotein receptor 1-like [Poecilia formosa]|uniref:asialoglycoprotein receptor 1-like n=1 Tax=Poecilia formosa TaxID=48698 RepID=UPI0007B79243|nr:PREDICTED: asialoglycoprotein receptor 1-like [Poecilia formosa]
MNQHDEAVADLKNDNEKSQNETENLSSQVEKLDEKLQEETKNLSSQVENLNEKSQKGIENLNQTIQLMQKFKSFLFNENCTSKECLLCKKGWVFFSGSCYFFSNMDLTWNESRQFCQNKSADLVVIDDLQEQTFIYDNI